MRTAVYTQGPGWVPGGCPGEARTRKGGVAGRFRLGNVTRPVSASGHDRRVTPARGNSDCYRVS